MRKLYFNLWILVLALPPIFLAQANSQGGLIEEQRMRSYEGGGGGDEIGWLLAFPILIGSLVFTGWLWKMCFTAMARSIGERDWGGFFSMFFIWFLMFGGIGVVLIGREIFD